MSVWFCRCCGTSLDAEECVRQVEDAFGRCARLCVPCAEHFEELRAVECRIASQHEAARQQRLAAAYSGTSAGSIDELFLEHDDELADTGHPRYSPTGRELDIAAKHPEIAFLCYLHPSQRVWYFTRERLSTLMAWFPRVTEDDWRALFLRCKTEGRQR